MLLAKWLQGAPPAHPEVGTVCPADCSHSVACRGTALSSSLLVCALSPAPTGPPQFLAHVMFTGPPPGTPFPTLCLAGSFSSFRTQIKYHSWGWPGHPKSAPCCSHRQLPPVHIPLSTLFIRLFVASLLQPVNGRGAGIQSPDGCSDWLHASPAIMLTSCVTLGRSLPLSVPQISHV